MKTFLLICIIKLITSNTSYDVDLDLPLREQYAYLANHVREVHNLVKASRLFYMRKPDLHEYLNLHYHSILKNQTNEWLDRIKIISEITGIDMKDTLMMNIGYEVMCTSMIIKTEKGIFMGRNYDAVNGTTPEIYKILVENAFSVNHYRNGELVYIGQGVLGFVSWLNGVKVGKIAISLNKRNNKFNTFKNIARLAEGKLPSIFLINLVLSYDESYFQALSRLTKTEISSALYFNIAGLTDGAIITRDADRVDNIEYLNGSFLVQTNSDREQWDPRRDGAEKKLIELIQNGKEITYDIVMNEILSKPPNWLKTTVYSTIQSPQGYFDTKYWPTE